MAKDKKQGKGKSAAHQVVKRASSPSVRASSGRGSSQRHMASARRGDGNSNRQKQIATVRSRGNNNPSRVSSRQIANSSPRKIDRNVASTRRQLSNPRADTRSARSQLAARSTNDDNSRVMRTSRADRSDRIDRRSTAIASSSPSVRSSDVTRLERGDRDRHRDRSSYRQRHEHHSSDWYRSNGWRYDHDYYRSHRHHRYYNDLLGVFIIDNFGPGYSSYGYDSGYGYGYSEPMVYRESYGVDYETRVAVQDALAQAGYYNGPIDGIIGSGTRSAILNYQYDAGLPATGMIDDSLVRSLGIY
jgi:hypothetical protein